MCRVLLAIVVFSLWQSAFAVTLDGVRLWRAPDHTRLVLDMSGDAPYQLFQLENPHRIVVDISNATNEVSLKQVDIANTGIQRIRSAVRDNTILRLVFDLAEPVKPRSFFLKPNKSKPHRLVIDLYDKKVNTQKTVNNTLNNTTAENTTTNDVANTQPSSRRDVLVVVDAGHGGEDPGAIGPAGTYEKVIALDIAKRLAKNITAKKGYRGVLTRTGDYFIPLRKRRDKARELRADLFISLHADAFKNPRANGASVYALSRRGATSETARFLAQKENQADLIGGVGDVSLEDKDKVLRSVLVDLSMTATVASSLDVGKSVLSQMGSIARLHKKQVEQAGFLVLKSPDVPSILLETGFISNVKEEKKLNTASYRAKMAKVIATGVFEYFERQPPVDSYLAWKKNGGRDTEVNAVANAVANTTSTTTTTITHKVVSGDSLSEIAQRYHVSMAKLKKLNGLKNNSIRIGQVLTVAEKKVASAPKVITHTVKSGETLSEIALRYKTSSAVLRRRNQLSSSTIRVGQKLRIYH